MEKIYNKLVRDKIPDIIKGNGGEPIISVLSDNEYKKALEDKLLEEYHEVLVATTNENYMEELADMLEVIKSLSEVLGVSLEYIMDIAQEKVKKRGSFKNKIYLKKVIED